MNPWHSVNLYLFGQRHQQVVSNILVHIASNGACLAIATYDPLTVMSLTSSSLTSSSYISLFLFAVPAPVSSLAADSQVTSVIITWEAPSVENETITEYQVACYPAGANEQGRTIETEEVYKLAEANELGHVIHTEDITVKITELQPGTTYVVIVRAVSEAGAGSAVTIPVTTEDIRK